MQKIIHIIYFKKYLSRSRSRGKESRDKEILFIMMLAFLTLGVGPCSKKFPEGTYQGKISSHGILNDLRNTPVSVKTVNLHHGQGRIVFFTENKQTQSPDQELFVLEISHFKSRFQIVRSFDVAIPIMGIKSIHLKLSPVGMSNYIGTSTDGQYEMHMSYQPLELEVMTKEGHIVLKAAVNAIATGVQREGLVIGEAETHFTSDELVERALKKNAGLLEKQEEVHQAHAAAQAAFARLLPHFTLGTILEVASFSGGEAVFNLTGYLIPFVFPDNWYDQQELTWQYRAAQVAQDLLRSQLITHVQSLAVDYMIYTEYKERLQRLQDQLKQLMTTHQQAVMARKLLNMSHPEWALLEFESDQLENEAILVQARIEQNRSELARAIGVANPKIVSTLSLSPNIIPFERIPIMNEVEEKQKKESWAKFAAEYSLEVRQQEYLKFAALSQEKGLCLHWLNPKCEKEYSMGFHLAAERKIIKSYMKVFDIHMSDLKKATHLLTYYWVRDRNVKAQQAVRLAQRLLGRLQWIEENFSQGTALLQAGRPLAETYVTNLTEELYHAREALAQYYGAKSIAMVNQLYLDRIAFRGQHAILKKHLDHRPTLFQLADVEEEFVESIVPERKVYSRVRITDV